jgi:hypothetical protein
MNDFVTAEPLVCQEVISAIQGLAWSDLTEQETLDVAWAYYFFSVQFRESLTAARDMYPDDERLRELEDGECDTDNLSPWPGVAAVGERLNHDEFMLRSLMLDPISAQRAARLRGVGERYLATTRMLDRHARALSISSYEDGGLEAVFNAMLTAPSWGTPALRAFRHFLREHIRFDSDVENGHGALARHLQPDERVLPLWTAFRDLLIQSVPALTRHGGQPAA